MKCAPGQCPTCSLSHRARRRQVTAARPHRGGVTSTVVGRSMSRSRHRDGAHGHDSTLESMSAIFMAADPDVKPVRRHQSEPSRVPANLTNQPRELPLLLRRLRFRTAARGARSPASRRKTTSDQGRTGHGARPGARARAKEVRERAKMTSVAAAVIARRVGRAIGFPQWCAPEVAMRDYRTAFRTCPYSAPHRACRRGGG